MLKLRFLFIASIMFTLTDLIGQSESVNENRIVSAAGEIISATDYCALITLDKSGHPQVRTMETLPFENIMVAWFGTNKNSRKVKEIENDPRVTIYYSDTSGNGYVVLKGTATIVNDSIEKKKHWKKHWEKFYTDPENTFTLIKVFPSSLEVVSYKHGLVGDTLNWRAPNIELKEKE